MRLKTLLAALLCALAALSAAAETTRDALPTVEELVETLRANYEGIQSLHVVQQTRHFGVPYNESLAVEPGSGDAPWDAPFEIWWQDGVYLEQQRDDAGNIASARLVQPDGVYEMTVEQDNVTGTIGHGGRWEKPPLLLPMHDPLFVLAAEGICLSWADDGRLVVERMHEDVAFLTLLLEPDLHYALTEQIIRRRQTLDNGIAADEVRRAHQKGAVSMRTVLGDFHEVAEGVFVPFSWRDASVGYDGELHLSVWEGRLLTVVVNEPIPARRFTLRFPRNAEVTDHRHEDRLQYTVGPLGFRVTHDTVFDTMAVRVYNYFNR